MATLTRGNQRALARLLVQDQDAVDPGISDDDFNILIANAQQDYGAMYPQEIIFGQAVSFSSGNEFASLTNATGAGVRYFIRGEITGSGQLRGAELERLTMPQIRRLQESTGETGTPRYWAIEGNAGSTTVFVIFVYPVPTGSVSATIWFSIYPIDYTNDASVTAYGEDASRWMARMAAVDAANILGRDPGFIQRLAAPLPERVRSYVLKRLANSKPMPDPLREQA